MLVELEQSRTRVVEPVCGSAQLCGGPPHKPHGGLMPTLQPSSRFNIIIPLNVSVMNRLLCHCYN